jgi:2'-5' RNA ligase
MNHSASPEKTVNTKANATLRLFYALWPDDATRERLAQLQSHVRGKPTRYDNLHITLAFLGEQPADVLPALRTILDRLPRKDIVLTLDRLDYFARKRIAWAGPHATPAALNDLVHALVRELTAHSIAFDQRSNFKPHATLARDADAPPDFAFESIVWHADRIALVQSVMQPDGVSYRVIAEQKARSGNEAGDEPDATGYAALRPAADGK